MARERKLTPEELALIVAQKRRLEAETGQAARDTEQKGELTREQIKADALINESKIGLGREEIGSKEKQTQIASALDALGYGSKESIAKEGERGALRSDLAKRGDIDQKTLATTLAESGDPSLYNARARGDVDKREQAVNAAVPELQKPNSGGEIARAKKFKAALDLAAGSGAYDEALARAYPKPENATVRATPTPSLWSHAAPATNESNWTSLANTLLGKSGVSTASGSGGGTADIFHPSPEVSYTGIGRGSLEGSKLTNLEGGRSELATPSGGTIGFNTPQTERRAGLLGSLIAPNDPSSVSVPPVPAPAGIGDLVAPKKVAPTAPVQVAVAPKPEVTLTQLLTNPSSVPTPTPTPLISPTGTPVPQATPQLTPAAIAEMLKKYKQVGTSY